MDSGGFKNQWLKRVTFNEQCALSFCLLHQCFISLMLIRLAYSGVKDFLNPFST